MLKQLQRDIIRRQSMITLDGGHDMLCLKDAKS